MFKSESNIEKNIAKLSSFFLSERRKAAKTLLDLAPTNFDAIREAKGIPPLIAVLRDSDALVRQYAVGVLSDLAWRSDANRNTIREAQGIVALVLLLRDAVTEVRGCAANALRVLAYNSSHEVSIVEAQCIAPLIALLKDADAKTREEAAGALNQLSRPNNQFSTRIAFRAQGISPLVSLLSDVNPWVRKEAACVLFSLLNNISGHLLVGTMQKAQVIRPLVALLSEVDAEVKSSASSILSYLSLRSSDCKNLIREAQGIVPLVLLLKDADPDVRLNAAGGLGNLAENPINKDVIREAQGIVPLVLFLGDADPMVRKDAARALRNLAEDNTSNQNAIRDVRGIAPLVAVLSDKEAHTRQFSAEALRNLADNNASNQNAIRDLGGIASLVAVLSSDKYDWMRRHAAMALSKLAEKNFSNQNAIREAQGIAPLVALLRNGDDGYECKQAAATALWFLAQDNLANQALIIECGALPELTKLASSNEHAKYTLEACQAKLAAHHLAYAPTIASSALNIDYSKKLGEGGFGIVYQGQWQMVTVAAKKLKATILSPQALVSFKEEAQRHGLLRHPNIVMLYGVCVEPGHYAMVMEFMSRGSLYGLLHSSQDIPWSLRKTIAENISAGLYYLHHNKIIHRDLKSLNVLLDDLGQAKLADFGLAILKSETQSTTTTGAKPAGTVRWMAPELFKRGGKYTESSDIYALGWVFWEIAARKIPFEDEQQANDGVIIEWVKDGERDTIPANIPPQYAQLIGRCWQQRAEDRPARVQQVVDALGDMAITDSASLGSGYRYFST